MAGVESMTDLLMLSGDADLEEDICRSLIADAVAHAHSAVRVKCTQHSGPSLARAMKARIKNCRTLCARAARAIAAM